MKSPVTAGCARSADGSEDRTEGKTVIEKVEMIEIKVSVPKDSIASRVAGLYYDEEMDSWRAYEIPLDEQIMKARKDHGTTCTG